MPDIDFPPALVDLQRRSHEAWAEVEAHRKAVDAARVTDADAADEQVRAEGGRVAEVPSWGRRALRPWTEAENAEHARLLGVATEAAQALRAGVADAGLGHGYDTVQALHKAARAE